MHACNLSMGNGDRQIPGAPWLGREPSLKGKLQVQSETLSQNKGGNIRGGGTSFIPVLGKQKQVTLLSSRLA